MATKSANKERPKSYDGTKTPSQKEKQRQQNVKRSCFGAACSEC